MAKLLENGLYQTYFSSNGFYKMGCLIYSIIAIYFNFFSYRTFKQMALEIFEYEQKQVAVEWRTLSDIFNRFIDMDCIWSWSEMNKKHEFVEKV